MQIYRPYLAYFKAAIKRHWEGLTSIESRIQKTKRGLGNGRHNGNTVWTRRRPALRNSVQWSTAKLILFLHTYLFFVPIYFQVLHVNAHNCVLAIVVKIDFKWIILVLYGIFCFVYENKAIMDVIISLENTWISQSLLTNCFQSEIIVFISVSSDNKQRFTVLKGSCSLLKKPLLYSRYLYIYLIGFCESFEHTYFCS